jgi:hypothetical protein
MSDESLGDDGLPGRPPSFVGQPMEPETGGSRRVDGPVEAERPVVAGFFLLVHRVGERESHGVCPLFEHRGGPSAYFRNLFPPVSIEYIRSGREMHLRASVD